VVASSTSGIPETGEAVVIDPTVSGTGVYTVHVVDSAVAPGDAYNGTSRDHHPAYRHASTRYGADLCELPVTAGPRG